MLNEVAFSAYSSVQSDRVKLRSHYCKAARLSSFFAFPVFLGISAIAPEAVPLILGDKWIETIIPLQLIAVVVPLRQLSIINTPALMGIGRPDLNVVNLLFALAIMPTAFVVGSNWGLTGVAWAWVCAYPPYFLILLVRSLPVLGVSYRDYFSAVWPSAFAAAVMFIALLLIRPGISYIAVEPLFRLLLTVVSGAIVYIAVVVLIKRAQFDEIISMVRR
jgi:O-antigen/teichoic acid export membrane protein